MKTQTHNIQWGVSLNNGETLYEEKGNYQTIPGELSPWQRLLKHIAINSLNITSLTLRAKDGRCFNLPSAGTNPRFKAMMDAEVPVSFRMFRNMASDIMGGGEMVNQELFTVAEATYEDGKKLQIWVDEKTANAWSVII